MTLDLENLGPKKRKPAKPDSEFSGSSSLVRAATALQDTYDRLKKLIYVIDSSYSMADHLFGMEEVSEFVWTPQILQAARGRIENARVRLSEMLKRTILGSENTDDDVPEDVAVPCYLPNEVPDNDPVWASLTSCNDELLKAEIVSRALWNEIGLIHRGRMEGRTSQSKIAAVKRYAKEMTEERVQKFADADLHLVSFDLMPSYTAVNNPADVVKQVEQINATGGDTNIIPALVFAIALCQKAPSPVRAHQIVLVTDALDSDAAEGIGPLVQQMLDLRIVLDFIHVVATHELASGENSWKALKEACEATGGKYTLVNRAQALKQNFFEASRRLMLTAPAPQIEGKDRA